MTVFPMPIIKIKGCLDQFGNDIELNTVGCQFEPYRWRPCGVDFFKCIFSLVPTDGTQMKLTPV